jgi:hypothetical protein
VSRTEGRLHPSENYTNVLFLAVTIADPKRVNDEDLGRSLEYIERPAYELTDIDFFTVRLGLARFQVAVNAFWGSSTKTYQMILDLDKLLERSLAEVPPTMQTNNAYSKPHRACILTSGTRVLQLTTAIRSKCIIMCLAQPGE